jgi:hypothetical protein
VLLKEVQIIHPVELVTAQNDVVIKWPFEEIPEVLANGIRGSLVPSCTLRGLLGCQDLDEVGRKIIKFVTSVDVTVEGSAVELRQYIDPAQAGIEAIADRYIDQPILASERYGRLRSILRKRE